MKYTFDYKSLFKALDARRGVRKIPWRQVSVETGVAVSTLLGTQRGGPMEADGVRAMVAWLGRAPEHFVRISLDGHLPAPKMRVSVAKRNRFDTTALHSALDRERQSRGLTWNEVASEIGDHVSATMLTRLKRRGRISMDVLVAATGWLGASVESLTYESDR